MISILEEDDDYFHQVTVFVTPLRNDTATDEESGDKEDEQVQLIVSYLLRLK